MQHGQNHSPEWWKRHRRLRLQRLTIIRKSNKEIAFNFKRSCYHAGHVLRHHSTTSIRKDWDSKSWIQDRHLVFQEHPWHQAECLSSQWSEPKEITSRPTKFQIKTLRPGLCWQTKFKTCVKYFTGRSALRAMNTTSLLKSSTYARSNLEQLIMIESAWTIAPRRHGVVILRLPLTVTAPNSSGEACQTSAKSFSGWVWGILHQTKLCAINGQLAPSCFKILRNQSNSRYIWLNQIQKSHNKLIQHHGWMWIFNSSKRLRLEWTKCPDDTLSLSSETKPPKSNYWYFTPQEWLKASHHTAIYCIFYISRKTITVTITTSMNWE